MISQTPRGVYNAFVDGVYERSREDTFFRLLVLTIFVWGFLDTASTYIAISAYGTVEYEWNPLTRKLLQMGPFMLTVGKGVAVLLIGLIGVYGRKHIIAVPGWKVFFRFLVWAGVIVSVVNLYAAYTAATGHDPVFAVLSVVG